jgi:RNase H-fold protein (predicted Holliday junction resolvase)
MPVRAAVSIDVGALQVGVAAVGLVEITAWPRWSTATHSDAPAHETPSRPPPILSIGVGRLQVGVAAVGLVEIAASEKSTATHSDVEGHEIASGAPVRCVGEALQVGVPVVGSVEITPWPLSSTATHKPVDGHEMPQRSG